MQINLFSSFHKFNIKNSMFMYGQLLFIYMYEKLYIQESVLYRMNDDLK